MHRAWRGRAAAAALALSVAGVLVGCNPPAGEATLTVTGAVEAENPEGTVTCLPPGDGGETLVPTWEWNGTIDGESARFFVGSQSSYWPDQGGFSVGNRIWYHLTVGSPGEIVTDRVDDDGTLHVTATLPRTGGEAVQITAALRCPSWGHAVANGALAGAIDGTASCVPPSGSDAYSSYEITSGHLEGRLHSSVVFAGLQGPAIDVALLQDGRVLWGAFNRSGEPPQIEIIEQAETALVARATLTRLDGEPGVIEIDASIACT